MFGFNVPGRIGREWRRKHYLDEDRVYYAQSMWKGLVMSILLYYTGREMYQYLQYFL